MNSSKKQGRPARKNRLNLNLYSLPSQIILSTVLLVILTSAAVGLPALWIIREQLDHQAWSQIEQGYNAAQSLYDAREHHLDNSAALIAQQPRLAELAASSDEGELQDYLLSLQTVEELDLLAICGPDQQVVGSTTGQVPEGLCDPRPPGYFYLVSGQTLPQVWLLASQPVTDNDQGWERLLTGLRLDSTFADEMRSQTGLEHTIFTAERVVATSQDSYPSFQTIVAPRTSFLNTSDLVVCCEYDISDQSYYGARLQLDEDRVQAEVALQVSDISTTQRTLVTVLTASVLAVAVLGSILGIISARRISKPLVSLSEAATRFSRGDLDTPVQVDSRVREVVQVSQTLEQARLDLAKSLAALREEKAWGEHLLESIVEGIVTLNKDCQITFFSHGAERITGWSRQEVLERRCDEVFHLPEEEAPFSQHIPPPGQKNQLVVRVAGGRQVILAITGARLNPSSSDDSEVALVFRDVSEEAAIHHLLGYFIANVTHEFRTPLSALAASIELLIDQAPDLSAAEVDELLKSLHLSVLSLQTLVDNLLESASIEAGHFRIRPRPYSLDRIITEAVQTMQPLVEKYNQQIVVEAHDDLPLVHADPRRVVQVLVNLISNANKYGPDSANISIQATNKGKIVQVQVADRGPGIDSQHRDLLFQRFEYPAATSSQSRVGAGLGLSVVKAIIEAHGGEVGVSDRTGGGSIFWFTLPMSKET